MYLVKVGEIFLKGKNRASFYSLLCDHISEVLGCSHVTFVHSMIFVDVADGAKLSLVFGIHSYLKVFSCSFSEIGSVAASLVGSAQSFAVRCSRSTKEYMSSSEIEKDVGSFVLSLYPFLRVDLKHPDVTLFVTICNGLAYVGSSLHFGLGGLPVGCSGHVYLEVGDEKLSTVAGFLLMKRGCRLVLEKDLPLLHQFDSSISVGVRGDFPFAVADVSLRSGFVLQPLIGYSPEEIEAIYRICCSL